MILLLFIFITKLIRIRKYLLHLLQAINIVFFLLHFCYTSVTSVTLWKMNNLGAKCIYYKEDILEILDLTKEKFDNSEKHLFKLKQTIIKG